MCDFEPLNRHVETLHQLVQAAQSVDEMSQTITDLLSEQRVRTASLTTFYPCFLVSTYEDRLVTVKIKKWFLFMVYL